MNFVTSCQSQVLSTAVGFPEICSSLEKDYSASVSENMAAALDYGQLGMVTEKLETMLDTEGENKVKEALEKVPNQCNEGIKWAMQRTINACGAGGSSKYCIVGGVAPSRKDEMARMTVAPLNNAKHIEMFDRIFPDLENLYGN